MKTIYIALIFSIFSLATFSQQYDQNYYLQKSKKEKTTGRILLIGGGAVIVGSYLAVNDLGYSSVLTIVAGTIIAIVSVPFLNASVLNKQRANAVSASLQMNKVMAFRQSKTNFICYPAFTIKIHFYKENQIH